MRAVSISIFALLLLSSILPSLEQGGYGGQENYETDGGYLCFQCPVCGAIFQVTPQEVANTNPYTPCPYCYGAYAGQFIQVQCPKSAGNTEWNGNGPGINANDGGWQGDENASQTNVGESTANGRHSISNAHGKILMVVSPKDYQEMEYNQPKVYFEEKGFNVKTASRGTPMAKGSSGEQASVDIDLKNVNLSDYSAVVFVGGEGIDELKLYEDPDYLKLAKGAVREDMVVGAICLAPKILANAGLLNGLDATSSDTEYLKSKGAKLSELPVVRSGKIITGNGPYAAEEFAQTIVAAITESAPAKTDQVTAKEMLPVTEENGNLLLHFNAASQPAAIAHGTTSQGTGMAAKWKCNVCGYIYDPAEHDGISFEQLPSSWKCPCGATKDKFEKI
jgi:protease I